ncbi:hypothetical protein ABOM_011483 [Aspergillus bombycis]|uniref:Uncharacterized protein n=1 Tax=Aspergillus bombycis TaxID=109264 RepID=A0A1F7ZKG8_9EURO|nr:hypothetical protein ABOM_011483 [Aspergillus bombycis]OGM39946.1 hypothetical protein ABOM_011483 [Aspergillus bombycis]
MTPRDLGTFGINDSPGGITDQFTGNDWDYRALPDAANSSRQRWRTWFYLVYASIPTGGDGSGDLSIRRTHLSDRVNDFRPRELRLKGENERLLAILEFLDPLGKWGTHRWRGFALHALAGEG